jgi:hypothetical protein
MEIGWAALQSLFNIPEKLQLNTLSFSLDIADIFFHQAFSGF